VVSGETETEGKIREIHMGIKASNIYALGVQLGIGSFQASVQQRDLAREALGLAKNNVNALADQGISLDVGKVFEAEVGASQFELETLREDYRNVLANMETGGFGDPAYISVYDFGVAVGIAEGQASSTLNPFPVNDPVRIAAEALAEDSMKNAANIYSSLSQQYRLTAKPVVTDEYSVIVQLRVQWQSDFSKSSPADA
jgi:hypothetical protein